MQSFISGDFIKFEITHLTNEIARFIYLTFKL